MKKRVYVDMDDVLCDFVGDYNKAREECPEVQFPQGNIGFFQNLPSLTGAVDSVNRLREKADVYILSAPSVHNPHSYSEKRLWIEQHFGYAFCDRLILSCHKNLLKGDYLIDDYESGKGQDGFEGELLVFGSERFPDWSAVMAYLDDQLL